MTEELLHEAFSLFLKAQECLKQGDETADERDVNTETDLHAGKIQGHLDEHRERRQDENRRLCRGAEPHDFAVALAHQNRTPRERDQGDEQHEELQGEDADTDDRGVEAEPGIGHGRPAQLLAADPGQKDTDDGHNSPRIEDFLLQFQPHHLPEKLGSHRREA
ncbi:MAG TPA: hypothetical protein DEB30_03895 [Candidatus Peribacter riflensis]|nr:hypothetical protein [Candidatus Peribacter riflensis]HBU09909.1 hypothetical protein [Candidatus Peribacter riflensis]